MHLSNAYENHFHFLFGTVKSLDDRPQPQIHYYHLNNAYENENQDVTIDDIYGNIDMEIVHVHKTDANNNNLADYAMVSPGGDCQHNWQCNPDQTEPNVRLDCLGVDNANTRKCTTIANADQSCNDNINPMYYNTLSNKCEDMTNCTTEDQTYVTSVPKSFVDDFNDTDFYTIQSSDDKYCSLDSSNKMICNFI